MSSSSLFRNEKLTLLDDQFDKIMEEYEDEEIGELDANDDEVQGRWDNLTNENVEGEEMQRLDAMFDEFLSATQFNNSETRLEEHSVPSEALTSLREELRQEAKVTVDRYKFVSEFEEGPLKYPTPKKEKWDVESVLTTASNIYNRPALIRELSAPRIKLGKFGMPSVVFPLAIITVNDESESDGEEAVNKGAKRDVNETKEQKKARKAQIKAERREARAVKKDTKNMYTREFGVQKRMVANHVMQEKVQHIQ
jgi:protein LTV1